MARTIPLLPAIEHQTPPTVEETRTFVRPNRDSKNPGVLDEQGNRKPPVYPHHVDDNLYADVEEFLVCTVCASALAIYEILGFPDGQQVGALSLKKLDTMYRPTFVTAGYHIDTRHRMVSFLPYKRQQIIDDIQHWLLKSTFTLLQGAELCGKLESTSMCNHRWVQPYFFLVQNTIRVILTNKWDRICNFYKRKGVDPRAKYNLPKHLASRLGPLIAREKAKLL
jgi:hypothetical protein